MSGSYLFIMNIFPFLPYFYNTKIVTGFSNLWQIWELIAQNLLEIVPKIGSNLEEKIQFRLSEGNESVE